MTRPRSSARRRVPAFLRVAVLVEAAPWRQRRGVSALARRAAVAACAGAKCRGRAELCIVLSGDGAMRRLNRDWRGQDKPTNVLSFPADGVSPDGTRRLLGDIVVAFGVTAAEAAVQGKSLNAHLTHLVVHGVLHLLGYDHETAADAREMEQLEIRILGELGVADPYRLPARRAA